MWFLPKPWSQRNARVDQDLYIWSFDEGAHGSDAEAFKADGNDGNRVRSLRALDMQISKSLMKLDSGR